MVTPAIPKMMIWDKNDENKNKFFLPFFIFTMKLIFYVLNKTSEERMYLFKMALIVMFYGI